MVNGRMALKTSMLHCMTVSPAEKVILTTLCLYPETLRKLRNFCPHNGFLKWLNCVLLMDDKVIFATSLDDLQAKIKLLHEFCIESGMLVNLDKTKIMIINKTDDDSIHIFKHMH